MPLDSDFPGPSVGDIEMAAMGNVLQYLLK